MTATRTKTSQTSQNIERVVLVRTLTSGKVTREVLPADVAVYEALHGAQNGVTVRSVRVEFGKVLDRWGGSG